MTTKQITSLSVDDFDKMDAAINKVKACAAALVAVESAHEGGFIVYEPELMEALFQLLNDAIEDLEDIMSGSSKAPICEGVELPPFRFEDVELSA